MHMPECYYAVPGLPFDSNLLSLGKCQELSLHVSLGLRRIHWRVTRQLTMVQGVAL